MKHKEKDALAWKALDAALELVAVRDQQLLEQKAEFEEMIGVATQEFLWEEKINELEDANKHLKSDLDEMAAALVRLHLARDMLPGEDASSALERMRTAICAEVHATKCWPG